MDEKSLPKPHTDLPTPEKDLPLPEKELTAGESEPKQESTVYVKNEPPEEKPHRSSFILKSFLLGILFVILVVLIGGGSFILGRNSKPESQQVVKTQVSAPSPTPDPTADWQTYTNSKYNISFKYPSNWNLINGNADFSLGLVPSYKPPKDGYANPIAITRFDNPKSLSIQKWTEEVNNQPGPAVGIYSSKSENSIIDGRNAYILRNTGCEPLACDIVVVMDGTNIFSFIYLKDNDSYSQQELIFNEEIFNRIISSIKFTETKDVLITAPPGANPTGGAMVACTMEAKLCPDGVTSVGRSGPKCEFEKCPGE